MAPNARTTEHHDDPPAYSWYHAWDPKHTGLMSDQQKAVVMDWIEQGIDFFGCDENSPRKVFGDTLRQLQREAEQEIDYHSLDYAQLHDQLLESLMAEQSKKATDDAMPPPDLESSASSFSFTMSQCSSHSHPSYSALNASASSVNSSFDSYGLDDKLNSRADDRSYKQEDLPEALPEEALSTTTSSTVLSRSSSSSKRGLKRPRVPKLHRRVMPALSSSSSVAQATKKEMKRQTSSASSVSSKSTAKSETLTRSQGSVTSDAVRVSLSHLAESHLPAASTFLHPQCRLQKDKGKGEPAGSNICAKGRDHCLLKLEQKIALLTRVAFGDEGGTAVMKQRPARVAEVFPNFTETRSIIELRMGFLSMQYGILLRWDTTRTGKVTLVVLRKMCPESFYTKCKPTKKLQPKNPQRRSLAPTRKACMMPAEPPSYAIRNVIDGNHAILQRPDGMEVALLEPPYRVDRPEEFQPTLLSVAVQYGTGLRRKSSWTVQLAYDGKTENILMTWDADGTLTPKLGDTLKHEISSHSSAVDLSSLEIRLFEHRQRRGKSRRCVSHMTVPLLGLEAQPTHKPATPSDLKVACCHDPDANLTLSVLLQSDYAHWLRQELDARRREEVKGVMWKSPFRVVDVYADQEEEEEDGIWEWICGAC